MKNIWLILIMLLLLAGCGAGTRPAAVSDTEDAMEGTPVEPPREVADFTLPGHTGTPVSLSDLRGRIVLIYFGYTFCPDVCPATLAEFVHVKRALGDDADQVAFVFISVDGERDTPEVLARYMQAFDPAFIGLQGDEANLRTVGHDFGLYYRKHKASGTSADYLVDHSAASYLLDQAGRLTMLYPFGTPPEVISADIREMLDT